MPRIQFTFLGSLIGGALSLFGGKQRNSAQQSSADKQMEFQKEMSDTAYQRGMKDMKAAGLNPILAGKLGGASTPQGAQAQLHDAFTPAVNTAMTMYQTESNVGLQQSQMMKIESEVDKISADIDLTEAQTDAVKEGIKKIMPEIERIKAEAGFKRAVTAVPQYVNELIQEFIASPSKLGETFGDIGQTFGSSAYDLAAQSTNIGRQQIQYLKRQIEKILKEAIKQSSPEAETTGP